MQTQHMQLFGSLVCVFSILSFNPPFHKRALAPRTCQPHQRGPLKPLGSSLRATFSEAILVWLQVAIEWVVMTQDYC